MRLISLRGNGTRRATSTPSSNGGNSTAPPDVDNRIVAARHEFAHAFGDLARGKRNWQLAAFAMAAVALALAVATARLAGSARVVPYVVQVDRATGQVVAVDAAQRMTRPTDALVASQLADFLRAVRTVLPAPAAAAAQAELVRRAYAFAAPTAAAFLNAHFADTAHDPRALGLRETREVDVTGVLRVPDADVWRLQWTETERPTTGAEGVRRSAWEGYVAVALLPPKDEATLEANPLGVYVTSISWTRLASTVEDSTAATTPRNGSSNSSSTQDSSTGGTAP